MFPEGKSDPVAALRRQVDLSPHVFPSSSPMWLASLGCTVTDDVGALALLGPGGLRVRGSTHRLNPDAFALSLASLASTGRGTNLKLALGLPPGARHLVLLIAATNVLR